MRHVLERMTAAQQHNLGYTIVAYGDSVTDGCFENDKDFENVWHARLRRLLNGIYPDLRINLINSGVGGNNTQQALLRLDDDVLRYRPDLVIICLGLNDVCENAENTVQALAEIVRRVHESGADIIYMTPNMTDTYVHSEELDRIFGEAWAPEYAGKLAEKQNNGYTDALFERLKQTAHENGAVICDAYAAWRALYKSGLDTTNLLVNRINHPTRNMHTVFAALLLETILLQEH